MIDCVFIHGWAMSRVVWRTCLQRLPDGFNPICVDLPGYGDCVDAAADSLDDYVDHVAAFAPGPSLLVGWSLGGLVALRLAQRYPDKVAGLFQIATSPRFVRTDDWHCAIAVDVFEQFAESLQQDVRKTIRRFLALQVQGTDNARQTMRLLQQAVDQAGLPSLNALLAGLKILAETDLRRTTRQLDCGISWLLGDKDRLVPIGLAGVLSQTASRGDIHVINGAGHAPMLSDADRTVQILLRAAERIR
jgi:pimeloyl-[acyl-carrier protein] methyl ester esterase